MGENIKLLKVFVASPSDTQSERDSVRDVIEQLNKSELRKKGYRLERIAYETDVTPDFDTDGQAVINKQIGDDWDIFVGILKTRFGTATPRANSGTAEEFNLAYERWGKDKHGCKILFFFADGSEDATKLGIKELEQLIEVKKFQEKIGGLGGIYQPYNNLTSFRESLRTHLGRHVDGYGIEWGELNGNREDEQSESDSQEISVFDSEPTLIDFVADGEEAMELIASSFTRMTAGMTTLAERLRQRTADAEKLKVVKGVSARRIRGLLKSVSNDIESAQQITEQETTLFKSGWETFKSSMNMIVGLVEVNTEEDEAAIDSFISGINSFRKTGEDIIGSTQVLEQEIAGVSFNQDTANASKMFIATLLILRTELVNMVADIDNLRDDLNDLLSQR